MAQALVIGAGHGEGLGRGYPSLGEGSGAKPQKLQSLQIAAREFQCIIDRINDCKFLVFCRVCLTNLVHRSSYSYLDRFILHPGDPLYTSVCNIILTALENGSVYRNEICWPYATSHSQVFSTYRSKLMDKMKQNSVGSRSTFLFQCSQLLRCSPSPPL